MLLPPIASYRDQAGLQQIESESSPNEGYGVAVSLPCLPADLICEVLIEVISFATHASCRAED